MPKKKLPWWPGTFGDDPSNIYTSIGILVFTYFVFMVPFSFSWLTGLPWGKYVAFVVLALYFAQLWVALWFCVWAVSDYWTRGQKMQIIARQTVVALVLTSPLICLSCGLINIR